jgi:hypothetical protein
VLNRKFHYIAKALDYLPADTVLDGELVALGLGGKSNFNLLQNFRSAESHITYYAFDVLMSLPKRLARCLRGCGLGLVSARNPSSNDGIQGLLL